MVLAFLMSAKGLSLASMLVMIAVNPKNAIKISFSHFAFNITMALLSFICPPYFLTQLVRIIIFNDYGA
jgi:hypothetical protein